MSGKNRQIIMKSHPVGFPKDSDFELVETDIPEPGVGQFVVKHDFMSLDPYMRGRMNPPSKMAYAEGTKPGEVMMGGCVGHVIASNHPDYAEGDAVATYGGWQEYCVSDGTGYHMYKIDTSIAPIEAYLGVLGMPGMTAYFGLLDLCRPKQGETVFVSAAAGAVGGYVGQIAKIKGCRVVGSAGSDEKVALMKESFGYDDGFNYKSCENYMAELERLCPTGIDCYFDNVGGEMSDAVFATFNVFARAAICGQISMYNLENPEPGPRILPIILVRQACVEGFIVTRFLERYPEGFKDMAQWLNEGKLVYKTTVAEGIENAPKAFMGMLNGQNIGKQLVKLS
jgi:NADPH-dependent curcumin reductase CurA